MSDPDVTEALRLLADAEWLVPDPAEDLARARSAQRRRTLRGLCVSSAAAVTAVLAIIGALTTSQSGRHELPQIQLVSAHVATKPYTFKLIPRGWKVQGQTSAAVTIAPDGGDTSPNPDDFIGKLVIMFDENALYGKSAISHGRVYWIHADAGYTTIAARTRSGEPEGVVRIQYPNDAGWSRSKMLAFLGSVHVNATAQPGLG